MRFWLITFWVGLLGTAAAQGLEVGAVLPLSGSSAETGQAAQTALKASVRNLLRSGVDARLTVLDSRSNLEYTVLQAQELVARGVHALVCCETTELAERLGPLAAAAGVPTFGLSPETVANPWLFSLQGGEPEALARLALEPALAPLALMAPTGAPGDRAEALLGAASAGGVRYPAGRTPLTPEALQVATLEPRGVVVWDNASGSVEAAEALSARGFSGTTVVRAALWNELSALERASLTGAVSVVSPAVLGFRLPDAHPSKAAASSLRRALGGLSPGLTDEAVTVAAAAWDAVSLVGVAAEQVLTYTDLAAADPKPMRNGLRDALIGLGPVVGAGGTYDFFSDFSGDGSGGVLADSLVLAARQGGGFRPPP